MNTPTKTEIVIRSAALGLCASVVFFCGCSELATVNADTPHTTFKATVAGQSFTWENPKDTEASNIVMEVSSNGAARLIIGYIHATQNTNAIAETAQVVTAQGTQMVNQINALNNFAQTVGGFVTTSGASALGPAVKGAATALATNAVEAAIKK